MFIRTHAIDCKTVSYMGQGDVEPVACKDIDDLKQQMINRYGKYVQPAYQMLPDQSMRQIGWIFVDSILCDDGSRRGVETWVEVFASPPIEMTNHFNFEGKQYGH